MISVVVTLIKLIYSARYSPLCPSASVSLSVTISSILLSVCSYQSILEVDRLGFFNADTDYKADLYIYIFVMTTITTILNEHFYFNLI